MKEYRVLQQIWEQKPNRNKKQNVKENLHPEIAYIEEFLHEHVKHRFEFSSRSKIHHLHFQV